MNKEIDSISISDFFWTQFKENRFSFSFRGLPQSIHFTIAWSKETGRMNFHITKNIGTGNDKPKFVIANFDKAFLNELMLFIPPLVFHKVFQPVSFKKYSRKERRKIRLVFLDDIEKASDNIRIAEELTDIWKIGSTIKRKRLIISKEIEEFLLPFISSSGARELLINNMRSLNGNSFNSKSIRSGMILMGKKVSPFISVNGRCYAITKRVGIYELLISFTNPEFAHALLDYIKEALERLPAAKSSEDTLPYNRPYQLYIENVG